MYSMQGLWLGIICALIVQMLSLGIITVRTNWEKEVSHSLYLFTIFFPCYFLFNLSLIIYFFLSYSCSGKESNGESI